MALCKKTKNVDNILTADPWL